MDALDASIVSFEQQPLDTLRIELKNEPAFMGSSMPKDDHTLTRFLKARGYNASQAKQMILDCVHWRRTVEDVGIEELYRRIDPYDFPWREEVFESWPMGFHKTDRFGRPVNIQSFGAMNAKRLYRHITPEEHWRTVLVNVESLGAEVFPAASAAAGRPIRQALVIIDLKGFGLAQFWALKSIARRSFEISQSFFPETMGQMLVINAPTSFTAIWSIVKPWLSPRTLDKISVLGANQHHAILHDLVPPENLPAALGGTCTCDPARGGCALSNAGPWMDDGRAERRARWLRGEIAAPGVPWPPPLPPPPAHEPEPEKTLAEEAAAAEKLEVDMEMEMEVGADLVEVEMGVEGSCVTAVTSSWGRASVVGLPLPLPHTAARAPVRLVV